MLLNAVASLNDLAAYFGYTDYEKLKGLIYPKPLYTTFDIPKRSGGTRTIDAPKRRLKQHQQKLSRDLTAIFGNLSSAAHGFVLGRSVVTNALVHVGRKSVVRVDLQDFFHQIHFGRVKGVFLAPPFNLPDDVSTVLAHLCCHEGVLPQGAPTSPPISNFVCLALDRRLRQLARRYKARYSRYSDDLNFSFPSQSLSQIPQEMFAVSFVDGRAVVEAGPLVAEIVAKQGFIINANKTRGVDREHRQVVTGIVVNDGLSVPRKYLDSIRGALYMWRKHGLAEAEKNAAPVLHTRNYSSGAIPSFVPLIRGKLNWLASVEGRSGSNFQRLSRHFNELARRDGIASKALKIEPEVRTSADADKATWYLTADGPLMGSYDVVNGTAFRYRGNVWITCAHCIGSLKVRTAFPTIVLTRRTGEKVFARVVDVDWHRDLAILRPLPLEPIPRDLPYFVPSEATVTAGETLGVMGFPSSVENQPPAFMRTDVVRTRAVSGVARIEIDKQIVQGNSGGPVFDLSYRVVGGVVEGASVTAGMNSCVSIREITNLKLA
ncbi:reverse transcriptase domain-containing protein [Roseateles sp. DXS20W]|uniref:RNA-directed DNA polymerase n=1 Tax=Pelomonas lactea TaxID=3299030 RepID=A0ABW7GE61_9BURK